MQIHCCVKGGRFLPGGSEPLTQQWICFIDTLEGEGPSIARSRKFLRRAIRECGMRPLFVVQPRYSTPIKPALAGFCIAGTPSTGESWKSAESACGTGR